MATVAWNKISIEEIQERVNNLGYKLLGEYSIDGRHKKVVIQDEDGYKYDVDFHGIARGQTPNFVDKSNPFVLQNISLWLKIENKPFILCKNNVYEKNSKKLFFQCLREDCQEIFDISWNEIYNMGCGCPFCVGKRVGKYNNLAYLRPELVKEWDYSKNKKNPEEYTEFSHEKVSWICAECRNFWDAKINDRSKGTGCPKCSFLKNESKIANYLKKYLKKNYGSKTEYKTLRNPETGRWLSFDIYIPSGENKKINGFYIEIHGEQHYEMSRFHELSSKRSFKTPEEEFEYQKHKDKLKRRFACKNGTYIEIDLRKIKTTEQAINYIESILEKHHLI